MWKWIGGCFLVCVAVVAVGAFWGYRKMKAVMDKPPVASVMIAATPERVFASMGNADSLDTWMTTAPVLTHKGMLVAGDSFPISTTEARTERARNQRMTWIVSEVVAPSLLVFEIRSDSLGMVIASMRDSLVARGDSTEVITTIGTFSYDSLAARARAKAGATGATGSKAPPAGLGVVSKMMVIPFRMQAEMELQKLKEHIEHVKSVEAKPGDTTGKKKG